MKYERPQLALRPETGQAETTTNATTDTWTRLDAVTAPIVRAAVLRLARAERALDRPFDSRASTLLDKSLVRFEELTEAGGR